MPNGIPIKVQQSETPASKKYSATIQPNKISHNILTNVLKMPPDKSTLLPIGQSHKEAYLKIWIPTGIKMIVTQHNNPTKNITNAFSQPMNINQSTFPTVFMLLI